MSIGIFFWANQTIATTSNKLTRIPDCLISLGDHTEKPAYAIVVEKSSQQLILYAYDGEYSEVLRYKCSTGKSQGPKMQAGDSKTPEGIYFFIEEHKKESLSPIYGTRAFPTDYPNNLDQLEGKTGSAIWMHGTNKPLKDFDSNGCIVLENADIDNLANYIVLNQTPIIIVEKINYLDIEDIKKEKQDILNWLASRNQAIQSGTYHQYLHFYSPDYLPDMSWWRDWTVVRKQHRKSNRLLEIDLKNIQILKFDQTMVIVFDQYLKQRDTKEIFTGKHKFFVDIRKSTYGILSESCLTKPQAFGRDLLAAVGQVQKPVEVDQDQAIIRMIDEWLQAWSSKNIERYGEFYATDFRSGSMDKAEWLKYKDRLNSQNEYIKVMRENIQIQRESSMVTVTFIQKYESSSYKAVGKKQLILKEEGGKWKIHRETWASL